MQNFNHVVLDLIIAVVLLNFDKGARQNLISFQNSLNMSKVIYD